MVKSVDSKLTLDEIYMQIGFGKFHIVIMIVLGLIRMCNNIEVLFLSFIGPILVCVWKISLWKSSFVTISFFVGMGIGTLMFGKWSDIYGRKPILIMCMCVGLYCSMLNALSPTLIWMIITKFIVGFFSAGVILMVTTMLTEIMPIYHRGSVMVSLQIFASFSSIYVTFLTYMLTESVGWRYSLVILISYMIIMTILAIFLPESPRYLLLINNKSEALKIVNKIASINGVEHITNIKATKNKKPVFTDLFHKNYARTTLILFYIFFVVGLDFMGLSLVAPLVNNIPHKCLQGMIMNSNSSSKENTLPDNSCCIGLSWNTLKPMLISTFGELSSSIISVYLVRFISRKLFIQILLAIIVMACLLINLCVSSIYMGIILLFGRGAASSVYGVIFLYASEVLPTSIRGSGVGIFSSFARVGLMSSSIIVNIIMVQNSFLLGTIILITVNIVGCLLLFALPYETKDRTLLETVDDDVSKLMMKENK